MRFKKGLREHCEMKSYSGIDVEGLDGHFCTKCEDGFWTLASERKLSQALSEHMAREDSTRVTASEIASVKEAAQALSITVQGVHKMMKEGRLRYVVAAELRLPIRSDLKRIVDSKVARPIPRSTKRRIQSA
jgi:hypothetical protein